MYRYIELNPVRAGMVDDPANYGFSSYQINALGQVSELCVPHEKYLELGKSKQDRIKNYQELFLQDLPDKFIANIRDITNRGMALGNDKFIAEIKALTGYDLTIKNRGRPVGWKKKVVKKIG